MGETIRIQAAAGDINAYLAPAQPMPGAPILLLHPWWGLNQTIRDLADRLAGDGFTVMAPDLFDGTVLATADDAKAFLTNRAARRPRRRTEPRPHQRERRSCARPSAGPP